MLFGCQLRFGSWSKRNANCESLQSMIRFNEEVRPIDILDWLIFGSFPAEIHPFAFAIAPVAPVIPVFVDKLDPERAYMDSSDSTVPSKAECAAYLLSALILFRWNYGVHHTMDFDIDHLTHL